MFSNYFDEVQKNKKTTLIPTATTPTTTGSTGSKKVKEHKKGIDTTTRISDENVNLTKKYPVKQQQKQQQDTEQQAEALAKNSTSKSARKKRRAQQSQDIIITATTSADATTSEKLYPVKQQQHKQQQQYTKRDTDEAFPENSKSKSSRKKRRAQQSQEITTTADADVSAVSQNNNHGNHHNKSKQQQQQQHNKQHNHKIRKVISYEAIELSKKLQELSQKKLLQEAITLYHHKKYDTIRDSYHTCVLVDCCSRCGDIDTAEKIISNIKNPNELNIEIYTALLKGYAHSGKMLRGIELFRNISTDKSIPYHQKPNIRTLNTLLRGCLWTATTPVGDKPGELFSGVVSSEEAWDLYCQQQQQDESLCCTLDGTSYEQSITLLCQSLRTDEAQKRINEYQKKEKIIMKGKATILGKDHTILETVAMEYIALARAYAILGNSNDMWIAAQRGLSAAKLSQKLLKESETKMDQQQEPTNGEQRLPTNSKSPKNVVVVTGGKQAWKNPTTVTDNNNNDNNIISNKEWNRKLSNISYRLHRLTELEMEAIELLKSRSKGDGIQRKDIMKRYLTKLFYFSGGGTTDLASMKGAVDDKVNMQSSTVSMNQSFISLYYSFGLERLIAIEYPEIYKIKDMKLVRIQIMDALQCRNATGTTTLNFDALFENSGQQRPLDIEIGAGAGDWIVKQAKANPTRNYVAVEIRADHVAQIFSKGLLRGGDCNKLLDNLCTIGSECGSFLQHYVPENSVSTIYANHPEPPTQTVGSDQDEIQSLLDGGSNFSEPAHMLNSTTISRMVKCLKPGDGRIVIVTDNRWYARFLSAMMSRYLCEHKKVLRSLQYHDLNNNKNKQASLTLLETMGGNVCLFQGEPNDDVGHVVRKHNNNNNKKQLEEENGVSYFDRLWRTGAGRHSERKNRFVLVFIKLSKNHK